MKYQQSWMAVLAIALMAAVAFTFNPASVFADDVDVDVDQESPSLTSPASVQRAENLAEAWADIDTSKMEAEPGTPLSELLEALEKDPLSDKEYMDAFGDYITEMRSSGKGWGQIAHELGIQPSELGLGHYKSSHNPSGLAVGHGVNAGGKGSNKGGNGKGKGPK